MAKIVKVDAPGAMVELGSWNVELPSNETDRADRSYVGVPVKIVPFFPFPDLSAQVATVAPFAGTAPVPAGSAPSNHKEHPPTLRGSNPKILFDVPNIWVLLEGQKKTYALEPPDVAPVYSIVRLVKGGIETAPVPPPDVV
jgi:hypothetical protein